MNDIILSIIIPTYNSEETIERLLSQILKQRYEKIEIIVIDNGSKDNTKEILNKYKEDILIYREKKKGVSHARNLGINKAKGEYITFFDSDDTIEPDYINLILKNLHKCDSKLLIFGYYLLNRENNIKSEILLKDINDNFLKFFFQNINYGVTMMSICNKIYKTEIVKKMLFDVYYSNGEDFKFNIRYLQSIKFQGVQCIEYSGYNYNIYPGVYKYRENSIETHCRIYMDLIKVLEDNKIENKDYYDNVYYYFWNTIINDIIAITNRHKTSILKKIQLADNKKLKELIKVTAISKKCSKKKKIIANLLKFNLNLTVIMVNTINKIIKGAKICVLKTHLK